MKKRRRKIIITVVIVLLVGFLWGSGLAEEVSARLIMAMNIAKTLDYYEYHWVEDGDSRLLSMNLYTWQKRGTQRKCLEYVPTSAVEAALMSYALEGYDGQGNCVWRRKLTREGTEETYWTYHYNEQGQVTERVTWRGEKDASGKEVLSRLQKYHYYENGMSASGTYAYQGDDLILKISNMTFYDGDGRELLQSDFKIDKDAQEESKVTLSLGAYGREELVCEGDRLIAYRWYDYDDRGNVIYLLEITAEATDSVQYLCTYSIYYYDAEDRLSAAYLYEPVIEDYPEYYTHFRYGFGGVDTGIILSFNENGRLDGFASAYYLDEDQPGEVLYYVFPSEDGTYQLIMK